MNKIEIRIENCYLFKSSFINYKRIITTVGIKKIHFHEAVGNRITGSTRDRCIFIIQDKIE